MGKKNKKSKKDAGVFVGVEDSIDEALTTETPHVKQKRADRTAQKAYDSVVKARKAVAKLGQVVAVGPDMPPTAFALCDGALGRVLSTVQLVAQKEGIPLVLPNEGDLGVFEVTSVQPFEDANLEPMGVEVPKE